MMPNEAMIPGKALTSGETMASAEALTLDETLTLDEALTALAGAGPLPREAMEWALDHWDQARLRFMAMLDAYARGEDRTKELELSLFPIIHMQAEMQDSTAFGPLCHLLRDTKAADAVLGDAITMTLSRVLVSTYDDSLPTLASVVETESTDPFVREAAMLAMAYLTHTGRVTEDQMRERLLHWRDTLQPQAEDQVWMAWVTAVACLGYADLAGMAEDLFERGFVDMAWMRIEDFREELKSTLDDPQRMAGFDSQNLRPFGSATEELADWTNLPAESLEERMKSLLIGDEEDWMQEGYTGEVEQPYVNPLRGVGRNDPCPCGSGKKYTKCCLV